MICYNDMLDVRNRDNYYEEVHCIDQGGSIGTQDRYEPLNHIIADIYNGDVMIEEDVIGYNLHIITGEKDYYAKTK